MRMIENIESKINQLSPNSIDELDHFLDYLITKNKNQQSRKLKMKWAGSLKDIKYNSVELQKKAMDWRIT